VDLKAVSRVEKEYLQIPVFGIWATRKNIIKNLFKLVKPNGLRQVSQKRRFVPGNRQTQSEAPVMAVAFGFGMIPL
jgi:hypothetical protein